MARIRIYELAEELGLETKVVVSRANELGIPVRGHMASLDEEEAEALKAALLAPPPEVVVEDPGLPVVEEEEDSSAAHETKGAASDDAGHDADSAVTEAGGVAQAEGSRPAEAPEGEDEVDGNRDPSVPAPGKEQGQGRDRNRRDGGQGGRRGRERPLSQDDPYWQFGTPPESWGRTRGDRRTDPSGLPPDDPYWQFGSPVESWGSSRKKAGQQEPGRQQQRPRVYLECQKCGVKIEKKRAHGDRKVPCPFCNKWMREVR